MLLIRFLQNREASVAPLLALAALPLFASVGASIDFGRAASARAGMQAAVDASALLMAKDAKVAEHHTTRRQRTQLFRCEFSEYRSGKYCNDRRHVLDIEWLHRDHVGHGRGDDQIYGAHGLFDPQPGGAFQRAIQYGRSRLRSVAR